MPNKEGQTALHLACSTGRVGVVAVMLRRCLRSTLRSCDYAGETPLHAAMRAPANHAPIIADLLLSMYKAGGVEETRKAQTENTQLNTQKTAQIQSLSKSDKQNSIDADSTSPENSTNPNSKSATKSEERISDNISTLLNLKNDQGDTALHIACKRRDKGCYLIAPVLLEHGANSNVLNQRGLTAIHLVSSWRAPREETDNRRRLIEMFCSYGYRFNMKSIGLAPKKVCEQFSNAVHSINTSNNRHEKKHSNVNVESSSLCRVTALHCAVIVRDFSLACSLVANGSSLSIVDGYGRCALNMVLSQHLVDSDVFTGTNSDLKDDQAEISPATLMRSRSGERSRSINAITVAKHLLLAVRHAPPWIPDDDIPACMSCNVVWTMRIRRHHCRHCGRVVCGKCSEKKLDLSQCKPSINFGAGPSNGRVRVCNMCYRTLAYAPAAIVKRDLHSFEGDEAISTSTWTPKEFSISQSKVQTNSEHEGKDRYKSTKTYFVNRKPSKSVNFQSDNYQVNRHRSLTTMPSTSQRNSNNPEVNVRGKARRKIRYASP